MGEGKVNIYWRRQENKNKKCYFELFFDVLYVFLLQMSNSVMDKNIYSIKSSMLNFVLGLLAPDRVLLSKLPN